jgi:hypothetical protein
MKDLPLTLMQTVCNGIFGKPATGESMDKFTLVHTQIQIIIIHFLPSPFPPIPNG